MEKKNNRVKRHIAKCFAKNQISSLVLACAMFIGLFSLSACSTSSTNTPASAAPTQAAVQPSQQTQTPKPTQTASPADPSILFTDTFQRADSESAGSQWQEVRMRNGTGNSIPKVESGDTPWGIKNNTLRYEGKGNNTYTEDYIQTVNEIPVDNVKVEFEMRGYAATTLGYVGPGFFWAPSKDIRLGGFSTQDEKQPLIGVQAFYGWESKGTKGLTFRLGGSFKTSDGVLPSVNANTNDFVKYSMQVKDGKLTYQAGTDAPVVYDLANKLEAGAKRHLSFDVRYYDNGVPFWVEIRNLKITQVK